MRVLGGRDHSLLETVHFGLRLPPTISSYGEVRPSASLIGPSSSPDTS